MGTRKKCEHGIFIGYDEKVKGHRVFVKLIKKILVSQHVQLITSAKKSIDRDLQSTDDVLIDNFSSAKSIPRWIKLFGLEEIEDDLHTGVN